MSNTTNVSSTRRLAESAIMVAIATVLSLIKLLDLPYGGSVTIACMLPIVIVAYRHGMKYGLFAGVVFGIIQQVLGLHTLSYVTTWQSIVAVILLDYVIAFMVTGFGGLFRKISSQPRALLYGSLVVCALRYICHVISGATVWAGLSIPTNAALIYSLGYNATYMVPETIVTAVIAFYVGSVIDFREANIARIYKKEKEGAPILKWIGGFLFAAALVFDVRMIFMHTQDAESGEFITDGLAKVNWTLIAVVSIIAVAAAVVLFLIRTVKKAEAKG
ncbi:MAG: energy-coupled thiamine transporter ThiT [Lachnospiraceae bacterium]|nr:energy-coupled thiamine transporter ThiT [Lachnospiraceae bacterium]